MSLTASQPAPAPTPTPSRVSIRPARIVLSPTQSYEGLCKLVLRKRMRRIVGLSAAATWILVGLAGRHLREGLAIPLRLFSPHTLLFAALTYTLSIIPILILRKLLLTTHRPPHPRPLERAKQLALAPSTWRVLGLHAASGAAAAVLYAFVIGWAQGEARLGPFGWNKKRGWQFNERFIFLVLLQSVLGLAYGALQLWRDRHLVQFSDDPSTPLAARVQARLRQSVPLTARFALFTVLGTLSTYLLVRRPVYRLIAALSVPSFRPHMYTLLRQNHIWFGIVFRAAALGVALAVAWEVANTLFDIYSVQPIYISKLSSAPNVCLLDGLRSADPYYQHFAWLEFAHVSTDPARRQSIFKDIFNRTPTTTTWYALSREALKRIGRSYRAIADRHAAPPLPSAPTAAAAGTAPAPSSPRDPRVRESQAIFRPSKKSALNNLLTSASSSSISSISSISPSASASPSFAFPTPSSSSTVPALFLSGGTPKKIEHAVEKAVQPAREKVERVEKEVEKEVKGLEQAVVRAVGTTGVEEEVRAVVRDRHVVGQAVLGLARLTSASLTEDAYGLVQRDIPRVLEALVLLLSALEEYAEEVLARTPPPSAQRAQQREAADALDRHVTPLVHATKDALVMVVGTFREYLEGFKFAPRVAKKLQDVVDYL